MDLSGEFDALSHSYPLNKPISLDGHIFHRIYVKNYCFDKTMAPAGKSVVEATFSSPDFEYWEKLYEDREAYKKEKERIARETAAALERIYPGFAATVEVADVATPMTYRRYTGNYLGSYMTWIVPPSKVKQYRMVKKTLPGLDNFWLSGMWVQPPGGVPTGPMTSRDIVQLMCKRDGKKFSTSVPER
jgi:phytoene dehydrogenase-like protein